MQWVNDILKNLFSPYEEDKKEWKVSFEFNLRKEELLYKLEELKNFSKDILLQETWFTEKFQLSVLNTPQSQGLVFKSEHGSDFSFFELYSHFIIHSLTEDNLYFLAHKEMLYKMSGDGLSKKTFLYLKPNIAYKYEKQEQQFGQISFSLIEDDNKTYTYKIQINYYAGYNYTEPKRMKELLEYLSKSFIFFNLKKNHL